LLPPFSDYYCPIEVVQIIAMVNMMIMTLVPHAITLASLEFVYSPISSLRFTKINMKTSKNGSSAPLATCENRMSLIKGNRGISTTPAPQTIKVGHTTIIRGDDVRTGVTAILPHSGNLFREKVPGAVFVGNAFGKVVGSTQVNELGEIETPILLTSTLSVPSSPFANCAETLRACCMVRLGTP
jgi:Peptidase family S58